jgi:hypothetical protein
VDEIPDARGAFFLQADIAGGELPDGTLAELKTSFYLKSGASHLFA